MKPQLLLPLIVRSSLRGFALAFLFLLITAPGVFAQSAISGQVTDISGVVMAGVTVEAASPVLIERLRSAITDDQGRYTIFDLRPGTYTVTFTLAGFNTNRREALVLPANFTATVNAEMRQKQQAQQAPEEPSRPPRFQGGLGMMLGVPVGEFHDNVEIAAGISIKFDVGLGSSPLSVGAESSFIWYGSESLDVPLVGMPELSVAVNTSNNIILFHGRVRAQRREGRVRPYVDGLVGLTDIYTTTSIKGDVTCTGTGSCVDTGDSVTNIDGVAFSAGGGAGFMVGFGKSPRSARLDVSVRYLYGGEAEYLTEGGIRWGSDGATLLPHRTPTHIVLVDIGVAFGR